MNQHMLYMNTDYVVPRDIIKLKCIYMNAALCNVAPMIFLFIRIE